MSSPTLRIAIVVIMSLATIIFLSEITKLRKKWFVSIANQLIPVWTPDFYNEQITNSTKELGNMRFYSRQEVFGG
jgi:hypothetical protein